MSKKIEMFDVVAQLDERFGKEGTETREAAEQKAEAFFTGNQHLDSLLNSVQYNTSKHQH
jgi:hypothetical protein